MQLIQKIWSYYPQKYAIKPNNRKYLSCGVLTGYKLTDKDKMRGNMNFCMYSLSSWVMGHLFFEREFWKVSFVNEDNIFLDIYAIFVTFPFAPFARTNEECRYKEYERITISGWKLSVRRRLYLSDLIVDILRKIIILPPSYTWKETARQKIYVRDRMKFAQWKKFLLSQRLSREGGWDGEIWNERRRKISWVRNGPESYENSISERVPRENSTLVSHL